MPWRPGGFYHYRELPPIKGTGVRPNRDTFATRIPWNNITANRDPDGSVTVQFGGYDGQAANCLPIFPGWNYMVRLYRPRPEILDGTWTLPKPSRLPPLLSKRAESR